MTAPKRTAKAGPPAADRAELERDLAVWYFGLRARVAHARDAVEAFAEEVGADPGHPAAGFFRPAHLLALANALGSAVNALADMPQGPDDPLPDPLARLRGDG